MPKRRYSALFEVLSARLGVVAVAFTTTTSSSFSPTSHNRLAPSAFQSDHMIAFLLL
ncbi:MAG TPA: hypothetical protein VMR75_00470 [Candidatus Saccharimonadales bacterium]|nr:hypothetical protein [Candidatus Saccharimonadales bacterium]